MLLSEGHRGGVDTRQSYSSERFLEAALLLCGFDIIHELTVLLTNYNSWSSKTTTFSEIDTAFV